MFVVLVAKTLDVGTCPMLLWTRLMSSVYVCSPGSMRPWMLGRVLCYYGLD